MQTLRHEAVEAAIAQIRAGRPVVVVDDEERENEGDLIFAAELSEPRLMAFLVRHTSGFVCVALPEAECDRLALPPMYHASADRYGTAYRVTVDAAVGIGTGISARDRARTARLLSDPIARPADFTRPGHVVPLAARSGGVLDRSGHTEAAVDLARLAGLSPAGVLSEIVSVRSPGQMARRAELGDFCAEHGLAMISIADLVAYRRALEPRVERVATVRLPTSAGLMRAVGYRAVPDGGEHLAVVSGHVADQRDVPVHVHVECLAGDVFGSRRCGCADRLDAALYQIAATNLGAVLYLRSGHDSAFNALGDADVARLSRDELCAPADLDGLAVPMLRDLGVLGVRQLYNPPSVRVALDELMPTVAGVTRTAG